MALGTRMLREEIVCNVVTDIRRRALREEDGPRRRELLRAARDIEATMLESLGDRFIVIAAAFVMGWILGSGLPLG